jgi:Mg-chelatase subunit ChlD
MNLLTWHAPWYLLAIPPILVALWWWSRQPGLPYPRRLVVLLMRMLSVVLLVMALAAPSWQIPPRAVALVVVRDVSASIDATALQRQATLITQLQASQPATALLGIVDVASTVAVAAIPSPALRDTSPAVVANRDATALAAAVTQAAALLPAGYEGRLLVLSDGQETRGRLRDTITALVARGIRVDVIPLTTTQPPAQAALTQVRLPQQTRGSGTLIADIDTTGSVAQSAILRVTNNGMPFFETTLQLPGSAQRVALTIPPIDPGMHRLEFTLLAPQDDALPDNRQRVLVQRDGALQILVLADPVDPIQPFVTMVRASGSTVTVRRPSDIDSQLSTLAGYDVIVLADTPARLVPPIVMQNIVRAVKTLGRGFLWLGGSQSLGAGGFRYTPLAEIAPVQFDPIDPTKRKRLAVLLIIDKSGSMADAVGGGLSRLDLAKEAAYQAIQGLSDGDTVGVAFFSDSAQWSLVPQPVPSADSVAQALGVVQSDGGTSIRSGLQLAQASIATLDGDVRHVMLLSDGQDPQSSRDIAQAFANQSVSLSTIALGADADMQGLSQLARIGQGVSYQVTNPQDLARVFLDETTNS